MNTRRKIVIDKFLGVFIAFPLNFLVRLVGFVTNFDHSLKGKKKNIVVCKYKGMGSIIQSTPLIQTLKTNYPNAKITFVSSVENKSILERITIIDQVLLVDDRKISGLIGSSTRLLIRLIRMRADLYIDLEIYSNFSSIITTFSMAKDRFGYYLNTSKYRMGMYTHMMYFNTNSPISESYLQFARLLNCEKIIHHQFVFVEKKELHPQLDNYIVINSNASDLRIERRWPKQSFIDLIHSVRESNNELSIVLIGAKNEAEYVAEISNVFSEDAKVLDLSGKTTLDELIELIRHSNFVITNDTGPMHMSSALQKKTIALFGPCSPQQYAIGENIIPIYKDLYCSPCVHEFIVPPCKGNNQCMKSIGVAEVLKSIEKIKEVAETPKREVTYVGIDGISVGKVTRN
ncbi:MAG: glycosyltransferase family 9 protein [Crocinitomicaceae bacterium]|nr:glycosyltransferase family 9 protein [Crocinitomicaceae bacterium]